MFKPKLAFVSDAIYPYNTGGKEKRLYDITQLLSKNGFEIDIYTMKWWAGTSNHISQGLVNLHSLCSHSSLYTNGRRSILETLKFSFSCIKLLTKKFDYLETDHMPYLPVFVLSLISVLKRKKLSICWFEVWDKSYWQQYFGSLGIIGFIIEYLLAQLPFTIISISKFTTHRLNTILKRKQNIITLPIGIDLKSILDSKPSKTEVDLIYSGRLNRHKQINLLIESINLLKKIYPNIKCLIVGTGPEKSHLQDLVSQLKLEKHVIFSDFFSSPSQLYSQLKSAKIFVLPSIREGYSITTLEAQACGLPVITIPSPHNAATDLIHPSLKNFQSQNSSPSLATYIDKLLSKKINKQLLIHHASSFSWQKLLPKYLAYYSDSE